MKLAVFIMMIMGSNAIYADTTLSVNVQASYTITALDWVVIVFYNIGMLIVGWYYSKRSNTTGDYLLGGRSMKPWAVGISLFASLLSTLTYLMIPGEIIQYGPMVITGIAAYPLIIWIVGRFVIPHFMKLNVATAYELLEKRLGPGMRMLGAFCFLFARIIWMALIIYATVDLVMIPLLGLPDKAAIWCCAVLGLITVTYSSMGGLRAVVFTDVVQTFVLIGGVILSVGIIMIKLGSFRAFWPDGWVSHWSPFEIWFEPGSQRTIAAVILGTSFTFLGTSISDQISVQRYMATQDVSAAKKMYSMSMLVAAITIILLAFLGLGLLAYIDINPSLLKAGETVSGDADKIFPNFLIADLPAGFSGLVIAGLLAAAMSSLSSGVNSSCSVITYDIVDRFFTKEYTEKEHIRLAKRASWFIGFAVVLLSGLVGIIPGNLLELTYKLGGLTFSPLVVMFFMALYIPWRTSLGTFMGVAVSFIIVIAISFYELFGLNVFWIGPVSVVSGILTGMIFSYLHLLFNRKQ